jgi:hypothetical protein
VYAPNPIREAIQRITELENCLHWYVEHDDTNEGDEPIPEYNGESWNQINENWLKGLNRARAVLGINKNDS